MNYQISIDTKKNISADISLSASKSIHNRVLIIKHLCENNFSIENPSSANDASKLTELLTKLDAEISIESTVPILLDAADAGTCFRFLTSYAALLLSQKNKHKNQQIILTGSARMQERPIGPLVEALKHLGAQIEYLNKEGFPPLKISASNALSDQVEIEGSISSQFITSLLLIAPNMPKGLKIGVKNTLTSKPYVDMTISLLNKFGIEVKQTNNSISVAPQIYSTSQLKKEQNIPSFFIESDWSAASYWYSAVALSNQLSVALRGLNKDSIQGDSAIIQIMNTFGVQTEFLNGGIKISKSTIKLPAYVSLNLSDTPDLAQTIIVLCAALGIKGEFKGLHTLRNKETDRINALKIELNKIGSMIKENTDSLEIIDFEEKQMHSDFTFQTYHDHRMAMSFAPSVFKYEKINIENIEVVKKSYPEFWDNLKKLNVKIVEI